MPTTRSMALVLDVLLSAAIHQQARKAEASDDSPMQSDCNVEREAGASPDPSWHSETDASTSTCTTACRGTRVEKHLTRAPRPPSPPPHSPESAIETMHYAGWKDGTTLCLRASKVEVASRTQTSDDGHRDEGHRRSSDGDHGHFHGAHFRARGGASW